MALKDNSPTLSYISWKDLIITYVGQTYNIQNSHTNMKYIYWDITNPYTLQCYNRIQPQSPGMYQLFINDRAFSPVDILIDTSGSIVSSTILLVKRGHK